MAPLKLIGRVVLAIAVLSLPFLAITFVWNNYSELKLMEERVKAMETELESVSSQTREVHQTTTELKDLLESIDGGSCNNERICP